ncbi:serine/threonine-protein phosphatase 4 regulatory subunit 4 isoform X2 [Canis lupus baileyi]|uniref:Serine/threonine-protein phosphatase 4 regulatory subunit 4 n=3 Tax=Canis lupus familiaris TaxID=9615 RepID=A0A8C0RXF0_CANLF|nr:serine/threonine-protein phosphatase 4 regulatory subunit 4 isoform X2 [Canis lupus familiaris]XP_038450323.1 serine/threonine-protein phosphatase 4 regulatory subunit 4 isoform X2 [Canis lupus familiaris]XP_038530457.1 serine/threonine-protein phosphatase 4 regulatory subunit 4 isoform X2 [Canis lupus familiaris]
MHPPPPAAAAAAMDFGQNSLFGYMEDLQELTIIERPVRRSLKTPEEIERLTVDEDLSDIERAVYLLSAGQDVQGTSVIANLPFLMRQNPAETLRRVLPKVRCLPRSMRMHTYLPREYGSHYVCPEGVTLWRRTLTGVSNAWLETLLSVIEVLPKETLRHEILNPLVSKAQLSQTVQSRLVSCKILGKLTNKFDAHTIKREILPLVKSLCQDVEYEVRSCMCRQLENIAQGIGTELTKSVVLPELIELSRDEGSSVRLAAFETLVNLLDVFDTDDRSQTILPLVKSFCEKSFKADESILISLSFHLGKLCHGLYGIFTPDQHLRFLEFYKKLCTLGLQQENGHNENQIPPQILEQEKKYISVRKNCAYNFPAMIVFVDPKNFHLELYSTFFCLCHDPEVPVRYTIAICFYEVSKLLNSGVYLIHKELITLLQDESLEVLDALIDHLPEILELMSTGGESSVQENKLSSLPDLIPALTAAEQRAAASLKWRTHEKLLQKYACLPHIISSDQIYYRFLQRMFTIMMTNNVLPVQKAASRTLCIFLRYNRKQEQRHEVIQKLIEQLGQGKSYWNRLRFLDTCEFIIEIFSKSFFCKYFFLPAIELTHDPVANVRMKLCYLLPKVKSTLKIPADKHLLQQLEMCVRKLLCQEKDKDVLAIVKRTVLELDRMEMSMDAFQKKFYEKDLLDQEKEREELLLMEMEQLEKEKQQNDGRPVSDKTFEKKRRDTKTPTTLPKSIPISVPGPSGTSTPSTSKEIKKSKLIRSQSFNNQAFHAKYGNLDKCASKSSTAGYTSSVSGLGKTSVISLPDDSFRTRNASSTPTSFPSNPSLPSTSRGTGNSVDPKSSGSKDTQPRKATLKSRKSNP